MKRLIAPEQKNYDIMKKKTVLKVSLGIIAAFTLAITLLSFVVRYYSTYDAKPFEELLQEAELVIRNVGGSVALAADADAVLAYAKDNQAYHLSPDDWAMYAPAIQKVQNMLPQAVLSWIVPMSQKEYATTLIEIPEHVVIRFGTHFSYAWMLIFATNNSPTELPEGVVHIGESVYLSRRNM